MINDPDERVRRQAKIAYSRNIFWEKLDAIEGLEGDERRSADIEFDKEYAKTHTFDEDQLNALALSRNTNLIAASYIPDNDDSGRYDDIVNKIASQYDSSETQFELIRKGYALEELSESNRETVRRAAEEERKRRGL